jgi:hypothetical protein
MKFKFKMGLKGLSFNPMFFNDIDITSMVNFNHFRAFHETLLPTTLTMICSFNEYAIKLRWSLEVMEGCGLSLKHPREEATSNLQIGLPI